MYVCKFLLFNNNKSFTAGQAQFCKIVILFKSLLKKNVLKELKKNIYSFILFGLLVCMWLYVCMQIDMYVYELIKGFLLLLLCNISLVADSFASLLCSPMTINLIWLNLMMFTKLDYTTKPYIIIILWKQWMARTRKCGLNF